VVDVCYTCSLIVGSMASQVRDIKTVPGTNFVVDGFRFTNPFVKHYFLTHTHSDHTTGLTKGFDNGLIYCSEVAARLLMFDFGIRRDVLRPMKLDTTVVIKSCSGDVLVTPISANHCPGAVMFVFEIVKTGMRVLHTGDFRWSDEQHGGNPVLKRIDLVMLDTTYCASKWTFPKQDHVVQEIAKFIGRTIANNRKTLFVFMSYHIGKERAYFGAAELCGNLKVYASANKQKVLKLLDLPQSWLNLLVDDPNEAQIHVGTMKQTRFPETLEHELRNGPWSAAVVIRPTGWSFNRSRKAENILSIRKVSKNVSVVGVPYSEHSSFEELQSCIKTLRPKRIIPTVNAETKEKRRKLVDSLCNFMDLSNDKSRIDGYFRQSKEENLVNINEVDTKEQKRLWEEIVQSSVAATGSKEQTPQNSVNKKSKNLRDYFRMKS
jgi:DNA cross-link repair 1A protein